MGLVWNCSDGVLGQLGHGDKTYKQVLTLVGAVGFRGAQIVRVSAGAAHSMALGVEGIAWTWGIGMNGCLGQNNTENKLVLMLLVGEALKGLQQCWWQELGVTQWQLRLKESCECWELGRVASWAWATKPTG